MGEGCLPVAVAMMSSQTLFVSNTVALSVKVYSAIGNVAYSGSFIRADGSEVQQRRNCCPKLSSALYAVYFKGHGAVDERVEFYFLCAAANAVSPT